MRASPRWPPALPHPDPGVGARRRRTTSCTATVAISASSSARRCATTSPRPAPPGRGNTPAISRIGYATSCPGPWNVTDPPRSTSTYSAPSERRCSDPARHVRGRSRCDPSCTPPGAPRAGQRHRSRPAPAPRPAAAAAPSTRCSRTRPSQRYSRVPVVTAALAATACSWAWYGAAHQRAALHMAEPQRPGRIP